MLGLSQGPCKLALRGARQWLSRTGPRNTAWPGCLQRSSEVNAGMCCIHAEKGRVRQWEAPVLGVRVPYPAFAWAWSKGPTGRVVCAVKTSARCPRIIHYHHNYYLNISGVRCHYVGVFTGEPNIEDAHFLGKGSTQSVELPGMLSLLSWCLGRSPGLLLLCPVCPVRCRQLPVCEA